MANSEPRRAEPSHSPVHRSLEIDEDRQTNVAFICANSEFRHHEHLLRRRWSFVPSTRETPVFSTAITRRVEDLVVDARASMGSPREILADLYRRHGTLVHRRARALLGDEQAAKDVCHEVFLKVWRARPDQDEGGSLVSWLYQVTTNHCLNVIRDDARRREILGQSGRVSPPPPELALPLLLHGVPAELQEIAIYYFVDEMSQDEIAELLGLSQRTVSNRVKACRDLLQRWWKPPLAEVS